MLAYSSSIVTLESELILILMRRFQTMNGGFGEGEGLGAKEKGAVLTIDNLASSEFEELGICTLQPHHQPPPPSTQHGRL